MRLSRYLCFLLCLSGLPGIHTAFAQNAASAPAAEPAVRSLRAGDSVITGAFTTDPVTGAITGPVDIRWDNGERFEGTLRAGKREGRGKFSWPNGQVYDGDWVDDRADGRASLVFPDRSRYQGEVRGGLPHGVGVREMANGDRYEGRFAAGVQDGEGTALDKSGDRYSGQWQRGVRQGKGRAVWANGISYEGDWLNNQPEGRGVFVYANGDRYEGEVSQGQPQGKGVRIAAGNGDRYEGQFLAGLPHGEGVFTWKSGDVYKGQWQGGKKVGQGRYTWANGDYWEGLFENDQATANGRLHFTPTLTPNNAEAEKLARQASAAASAATSSAPAAPARPGSAAASSASADNARLLAIPMVAKELRECQRQNLSDCASRVVREINEDRLFRHRWQQMSADKDARGRQIIFEVDANSELEDGNVYSWLRTGDGSTARKIGIKYDCRAQSLQIQLIYQCSGAELRACTLDQGVDRYAGRVIPATDIKNWFKNACERS